MLEVYKYGGTVLNDKKNRERIYKFLKRKINDGVKIFMVVSAFGREKDSFSTDNLGKNIELLNNFDKDQIMTFGEIYSSLLIKNELLKEGVKVENACYDEIGIMCDNNYQDGNIIGIDMSYLSELIHNNDIVVVPGFIGESLEGKIISLGRNTSDLTGVIIAKYFNLDKVNIIKEVNGVYKKDPKVEHSEVVLKNISYEEMISLLNAGSKMFAIKTIKYARDNNIVIDVKGLNDSDGTIISKIESNENILFVNKQDDEIKIVFKDMKIFNEIFKEIISKNIKLDELMIIKNIVYLKGKNLKIDEILDKYIS